MYESDSRDDTERTGQAREDDDRLHRSKHDEEEAIEFNRPQMNAFHRVDEE